MAKNYRGEGEKIDFPYVVQTGVTITAGSLVWVDVSGTNVVHVVRGYSGASAESSANPTGVGIVSLDVTFSGASGMFIGVMANTQTGASQLSGGHATGVTIHRRGMFEFMTTPTSSSNLRIGYPAYATRRDTVMGAGPLSIADGSGTNVTGGVPIGRVCFFPNGPHTSGVAVRVWVYVEGQPRSHPNL